MLPKRSLHGANHFIRVDVTTWWIGAKSAKSMIARRIYAHAASLRRSQALNGGIALTEVRHDWGRESGKPFRFSSGSGRVCTTFAIQFEVFRKAETELLEE